jgi:hypothetical protein
MTQTDAISPPKSLLVIKPSSLGDIVHGLQILEPFTRQLPAAGLPGGAGPFRSSGRSGSFHPRNAVFPAETRRALDFGGHENPARAGVGRDLGHAGPAALWANDRRRRSRAAKIGPCGSTPHRVLCSLPQDAPVDAVPSSLIHPNATYELVREKILKDINMKGIRSWLASLEDSKTLRFDLILCAQDGPELQKVCNARGIPIVSPGGRS